MKQAVFYRYIRPCVFYEKTLTLQTSAKGGVCLRFARTEDGLFFTHARCNPLDLFSKSVAKKIADRRAEQWPTNLNLTLVDNSICTEILLNDVISLASTWQPTIAQVQHNHTTDYIKLELNNLSVYLGKLIYNNYNELVKLNNAKTDAYNQLHLW